MKYSKEKKLKIIYGHDLISMQSIACTECLAAARLQGPSIYMLQAVFIFAGMHNSLLSI